MIFLSKLINISGIYFYLLFIISSIMWGYIFYLYSRLTRMEKYELKSFYVQNNFLNRLKTVFFLAGAAPLLGLLGTVDGIIDIFKGIGATANISAGIMAGGIGRALTTTQAGLIIAIPGLIAGNFIREKYSYPHELKKKGKKKMRRRKDNNITNDLNMTPLLDMVFILLIFFVVTSSFIQNQILEISLPSASSGKTLNEKINIVSITKEGEIYWNKEAVSRERLGAIIDGEDLTKKIIVSPDRELSSGGLVEILDFLRGKNIDDIAISVKKDG